MNGAAVKSKSGTTAHFTSFKLMNNIITKNDITPLSKSKSKTKVKPKHQTEDKKEIEEREPEIIDSIPSDMKPVHSFSASSSDHSGSDDNDGLFSPMSSSQLDGENDYSYYSDEMEHLKKFQLHKPNFINNSNNRNDKHHSLMHDNRLNSFDFDEQSSLPELSNDYSNTEDDFWKEVTSTNEEAISLPKEEYNDTTTTANNNNINDGPLSENGIVSVEDFMADDLTTNVNNNNNNNNNDSNYVTNNEEHDAPAWNENVFQDSKQRVKLLCYRDADGKLALKTRNVPMSATNPSKRGMFLTAAGLARRRRNKHRKLLKKAIRRKSGVAEMLSTDVGISELML